MENNISTLEIPLQPPYKIIKHGNKIGVQIGIKRLTISKGNPLRNETHTYPLVAVEDKISALKDKNISIESNGESEVWDNVETKHVSELCELGAHLQWMDFIKILWHDHARLGNRHEKIQKVQIFNKLIKYNGSQELPSPGQYTIHLHTESSGSVPEVVCSARDDIFALNVVWTDDPMALEQSIVSDLMEYLLIISPNQSARWWRMTYETDEEQLRPLIDRLNANAKATSFRNTLMASFKVTALMPYKENFDSTILTSSHPSSEKKAKTVKLENKIERQIDIERLKVHFKIPFQRNGFETLISMLKIKHDPKGFAMIANQIYISKHFRKEDFNSFSAWYRAFCELVGCKYCGSYKPNKLKPTKVQEASFLFLK